VVAAALPAAAAVDPAAEALMQTWNAAKLGSCEEFLLSLDQETATAILGSCADYLDILRSLSAPELFLLFAAMRVEAAPGEVANWDGRAVLELMLTAPAHAYFLDNSNLQIDSLQEGESCCMVAFTIRDPSGRRTPLCLPVVLDDAGWRVSGLDTLMTTLIENSFFY
jgi:hypothetical protein